MTDLRTAAQQALEALLTYEQYIQPLTNHFGGPRVPEEGSASAKVDAAITALRAALAEPVQEPVAGRAFLERILTAMEGVIDVADRKTDEFDALRSCVIDLTSMLHTAPPQRKPLTEEEIQAAWDSVDMRHPRGNETRIAFTRAIERAHGIGGQP